MKIKYYNINKTEIKEFEFDKQEKTQFKERYINSKTNKHILIYHYQKIAIN